MAAVSEQTDDDGREAGRLLFARPWRFLAGVASVAGLPAPEGIEVAFAGRSNVGKSSLINALTGRKALAKTSDTPGRTRQLNLFGADAGVTIVDMPGYGYARAPKKDVALWTALAFDYIRGRPNLRRVYLLIDSRRGLLASDREALDLLDAAAVSCQVVLTKSDALKTLALEAMEGETAAAIAKRAAAHPQVLATSARTGVGLPALRAEIAALAATRDRHGA
jgi:GTP-binding protein